MNLWKRLLMPRVFPVLHDSNWGGPMTRAITNVHRQDGDAQMLIIVEVVRPSLAHCCVDTRLNRWRLRLCGRRVL